LRPSVLAGSITPGQARARVLPILFADPAGVAVANAIGLAIPSVCVLHA